MKFKYKSCSLYHLFSFSLSFKNKLINSVFLSEDNYEFTIVEKQKIKI